MVLMILHFLDTNNLKRWQKINNVEQHLEKSILSNILGLSCIENYILGILRQKGIDVTRLYCRSFVSAEKLYDDVFNKDLTYENYTEIPRIHSIAKKLGVIDLQTVNTDDTFNLNDFLKSLKVNEYIMIKVSREFMMNKFKAKTWRNDHYMLVFMQDNSIRFVNTVPLSDGVLTQSELLEAYNHSYIKMTVLRKMNKRDTDLCMVDFIVSYNVSLNIHNYSKTLNIDNADTIKTKHLLLIYKVLVKRTIEFLRPYFNLDNLSDYILQLNKYIARTEYTLLRNKQSDYSNIHEIVSMINFNRYMFSEIKRKFEV
jgi:hypothetical protein